MASENTNQGRHQSPGITSENTHRARAEYRAALAAAPLSPETVRTYVSKVRGYLAWLVDSDLVGDPLIDRRARDWAVRDYRAYLLTVTKRAPATINNALAAIDDFYTRQGLGPATAQRLDLPAQAPKALDRKAALRWLRAISDHPAPRDRVLALLPFYAGLRIAEAIGLDLDDVRISARKGDLRVHGKGDKIRTVPIHPELSADLRLWLDERSNWPTRRPTPRCCSTAAGGRLSTRAASAIFQKIATAGGLDDEITAHTGRHTFATTLIRAAAPTSSWSPTCSATPASKPSAYTPVPPPTTAPRPSISSRPTADPAECPSMSCFRRMWSLPPTGGERAVGQGVEVGRAEQDAVPVVLR